MKSFLFLLESTIDLGENMNSIIEYEYNPDLKGYQFIKNIYEAIVNKVVLKIIYKPYGKDEQKFSLSPYYLKQYNNRWFLFGKEESEHYTGITNLALDRIQNVTETIEDITPNTTDWGDFFDQMIGVSVVPNQETIDLKLRFSVKSIPYVITKPIHGASQRLDKTDIENRTIFLNLLPNREMYQAILSFGSDVEVLGPIEVIDEMKKITDIMKKYYD